MQHLYMLKSINVQIIVNTLYKLLLLLILILIICEASPGSPYTK
jgi:hypothetical protein